MYTSDGIFYSSLSRQSTDNTTIFNIIVDIDSVITTDDGNLQFSFYIEVTDGSTTYILSKGDALNAVDVSYRSSAINSIAQVDAWSFYD